jgi:SET domain-containing protein
LPPLTADDFAKKPGGAGGQKAMKVLQRVRMGGVNVEKILTPEERASKDTMVASLQHRLLQSTLKGDQEKALRDFLDSKTTIE